MQKNTQNAIQPIVNPSGDSEFKNDPKAFQVAIGIKIRNARISAALSQKQIAEQLSVSYQQIHKYESGRDSVPLYRLLKIASICNISPIVFLEKYPTNTNAPYNGESARDVLQLVTAYRKINNESLRITILRFVKELAEK